MAWDFEADAAQQTDLGGKLVSASETFLDNCKDIVETQVGTNLSAAWVGDDYDTFNQGVQGYYPAIQDLGHTFALFGKHFQSMSGGTEALGDNLIAVADALLEGGVAGSTVGAPGEGLASLESLPTNQYGGVTLTMPDGRVVETDANGNKVIERWTEDDGTEVVRYYYVGNDASSGAYSETRTVGDSTSVVFYGRDGSDLRDRWDHTIFNDDGTFVEGYEADLRASASENSRGVNEFQGYNRWSEDGQWYERLDRNGNVIERTDAIENPTHREVILGPESGGGMIATELDESGAIVSAALVVGTAAPIALNVVNGRIEDSQLEGYDFIDPATGRIREGAFRAPGQNLPSVSQAMDGSDYAEPTIDSGIPTENKNGGFKKDEILENDDEHIKVLRTYEDGSTEVLTMDKNTEEVTSGGVNPPRPTEDEDETQPDATLGGDDPAEEDETQPDATLGGDDPAEEDETQPDATLGGDDSASEDDSKYDPAVEGGDVGEDGDPYKVTVDGEEYTYVPTGEDENREVLRIIDNPAYPDGSKHKIVQYSDGTQRTVEISEEYPNGKAEGDLEPIRDDSTVGAESGSSGGSSEYP